MSAIPGQPNIKNALSQELAKTTLAYQYYREKKRPGLIISDQSLFSGYDYLTRVVVF